MIRKQLHEKTIRRMDAICSWFQSKTAELTYPIYSSYDIRDSGYKIVNVDANIYPAGFNNICPTDKETAPGLFAKYLNQHYQNDIDKILLVTEEHTNNAYYWENVWTIQDLLTAGGYEVRVALAKSFETPLTVKTSSGRDVTVYSAGENSNLWKEFTPDLVVSNNDFSEAHEEWAKNMVLPMNPPREMGWYQRKKSRYFENYNSLVNEFAEVADIDPFLMRVETEEFLDFDINNEESREALAQKVDTFLTDLKISYQKRGLDQVPFAFVKNNSGTYGLAVTRVSSGQEIREWNYKSRKKMKAAKGGRDVEEVIIQEGVPSVIQADGATAEPVIYMIGCQLVGGFLRTHSEKSSTESLNSPGAIYKRLCVSDLLVRPEGCVLENVYKWSAKLGLLAIGLEAGQMGVTFKGFHKKSCT
ncbi:MAG: glutamate--cysteine ligase [Bdellovibrionales bacterium]|nr:glutamate--cysteine ligase [Bdellovibrionales bacterium]